MRRRILGAVTVLTVLAAPAVAHAAKEGYRAEVRRTTGGWAHVKANDYGSLGFGYGYAYAQDQLCELADIMVTVNAQRSRYFGPSDGNLESATVTVSITVNPVDDVPVAADDSYNTTEEVQLVIAAASGVLANDSDPDSVETATLLAQTMDTLAVEYQADGKGELFESLKPYLAGTLEGLPYAELAAQVGMSVGSIKVAVHRLRRRCGDR